MSESELNEFIILSLFAASKYLLPVKYLFFVLNITAIY